MDIALETRVKRPGIVTAIVILDVVTVVFAVPTAFLLLMSGESGLAIPAILIITSSALKLIYAVGLWMLRRWARVMAIVVSALLVPFSIFGIVNSGGRDPGTFLGLVVAGLTLYALVQVRVRTAFT